MAEHRRPSPNNENTSAYNGGFYGDTKRMIYDATNGRMDLGVTDQPSTIGEDLARATARTATQGTRVEENYIHENQMRVQRTAAVASLVFSNYEDSAAARAYRSIHFDEHGNITSNNSGISDSDWLDRIGLGTQKENEFQSAVTRSVFSDPDGNHTNFSHISHAEMNQLTNSGYFTRNGIKYEADSNDLSRLQTAANAARNEASLRNSVAFQNGAKNQREAMAIIHQRSLSYMQSIDDLKDIKTGTKGEIDKKRKDLNNELNVLKNKQGNGIKLSSDEVKRMKTLEENIGIVDKYSSTAMNAGRRGGMTGQQRYGLRVVGNKVIGSDMMMGVDFYRKSAQITTMAVKGAYRGALGLTGNALQGQALKGVPFTGKLNKWGANFSEKYTPTFNKAGKKLLDHKEYLKELDKAKRNGTLREFRREQRNAKKVRNIEKTNKRRTKQESKLLELKDKKNKTRIDKAREKLLKTDQWFSGVTSKWWTRAQGFSGKAWRTVTAPGRAVKKVLDKILSPLNLLRQGLNAIKKFLMALLKKYVLIPVGGFLLVWVLLMAIIPVLLYVLFFISDLDSLEAALNKNNNYVQDIVDLTNEQLAMPLMDALKHDAESYYLNGKKIKTDANGVPERDAKGYFVYEPFDGVPTYTDEEYNKYSFAFKWKKDVGEGEIGTFYAKELVNGEQVELSGVNDNLVAIVSMMHMRYYDEIDFQNWQTARGYVYYMYALSHSIESYEHRDMTDENGAVLKHIYGDLCGEKLANGTVKKLNPIKSATYDESSDSINLKRETKELCSNIYIHGYDPKIGLAINKAKAAGTGTVQSGLELLLGKEIYKKLNLSQENLGIFKNEVPHEYGNTSKKCTVYQKVRGKLTCTKKETSSSTDSSGHTHGASCYDWYYICKGHCGGHVTPVVNVSVTMTYEELAQLDHFRTTRTLQQGDFNPHSVLDLVAEVKSCRNLEEWQKYWMQKAFDWFLPFPTNGEAVLEQGIKDTIHLFSDSWEFWKSLFSEGYEAALYSGDNAEEDNTDDLFDWDGWFIKVPDPTDSTRLLDTADVDPKVIGDLVDIYGAWVEERDGTLQITNYELAYEEWEGVDNVVFPVGGKRLTSEQKKKIKDYLITQGIADGSKRMNVIEEAMDCCGSFFYSLTGEAHQNGLKNRSGRSDCSGFVGGVLNRGLDTTKYGVSPYTSASTYKGSGSRQRGSVISHGNGGKGSNGVSYSGHVMFYIGELPDGVGPDGAGKYVIDCSSTAGGSSMRKLSDSSLSAYTGTLNYW